MNLKPILFVSALACVAAASAAGVAQNSLLVVREGGSTSAAASVSLVNYLMTGGAAVNTYTVTGLTHSGSATSEGALNISADHKKVSFTGYGAAPGTASVVGGTSARLVGTLTLGTGSIDVATTTGQFSANNIRSSYVSGTSYFATGANGGLAKGTLDSGVASSLGTSSTNLRVVKGYGGSAYFSTGSTGGGNKIGIYRYDAAATGKQTLVLDTSVGSQASPYDFEFVTPTSLIVADDTAGIKLYTKTGGTWAVTATLANSAARSLTLFKGNLYFVAASGLALNKVSFNGSAFGTVSTLETTTAANPFRGVEAVPEPSSFLPLALGALALLRRRRKA